jgi:hypothetical protein
MKALRDRYRAGNQAAAELILSDPAKHGGEGALAVQWARLVVKAQSAAPFTLTPPAGANEHGGPLHGSAAPERGEGRGPLSELRFFAGGLAAGRL